MEPLPSDEGGFWAIAGGPEGFELAEWGTGNGPGVSLDAAIEAFEETCDIQVIDRGNGFVNLMYRCPDQYPHAAHARRQFVGGEWHRCLTPIFCS